MQLLETLQTTHRMIEDVLNIHLEDADFADGREEIEHIYLHEACHAAVAHCVPWVHTLEVTEHTAVDELMARFLEMEIGEAAGMPVHSSEAFVEELAKYPVDIGLDDFDHLKALWGSYFWPNKDLAGMASYVLTYLRYRQVIYHIIPSADWNAALTAGIYTPGSVQTEGFIHCSKIDQVIRTANTYFNHQSDLLLLTIIVSKVEAELRWEDPVGTNNCFPHIYGPLNLEAVAAVNPLEKGDGGKFVLPVGLSAVAGGDRTLLSY